MTASFRRSSLLLLALFAVRRRPIARLTLGAGVTVLVVALFNLAHFSQGWVQWGYRFSLDFIPFILPLVARWFFRYVARDASFTDLVAQTPDLAQCSHTVRPLEPGAYLWRVAAVARDAQGERDQGPFSRSVPFQVIATPPTPSTPSVLWRLDRRRLLPGAC